MKKKILVCGLGGRGFSYVRNLLKAGICEKNIVGVDIDDDRVDLAQRQFPQATFFVEDATHLSVINNESRFVSPIAVYCLQHGITIAIVATNTPSHHRVTVGLIQCGVRNIFCEDPLGISRESVAIVYQEMQKHLSIGPLCQSRVKVYTGSLLNFSHAVQECIRFMQRENVIVVTASAVWIKSRHGDKRPTVGVTTDALCLVRHMLRYICQNGGQVRIASSHVAAKVTREPYADIDIQRQMHESDESFPLCPDATVTATETLSVAHRLRFVTLMMYGSFVHKKTVRQVRLRLARKEDNSGIDSHEVLLEFDVRGSLGACDKMTITHLKDGASQVFEFDPHRMLVGVQTFLEGASGNVDAGSRFANIEDALNAAAFTEAVLKSADSGKLSSVNVE